jgi:hypothetical protein
MAHPSGMKWLHGFSSPTLVRFNLSPRTGTFARGEEESMWAPACASCPTFLSNTLLRVDFAHLFAPSANSLVQFGITQYF